MKLTLAIAFAAIAFAQETKPAPFTMTEKVAIGTILEREAQLEKQAEAIVKQLQELRQLRNSLVGALYTARPTAKQEDWVPKQDMSDWVKPTPAPAPAEPK